MKRCKKFRNLYIHPDKICKYYKDRTIACYNYDDIPENCATCSRNPHKFDNRPITKGQIICLTNRGYALEDIKDWDFKKAYQVIGGTKK